MTPRHHGAGSSNYPSETGGEVWPDDALSPEEREHEATYQNHKAREAARRARERKAGR